MSTPDYTPQEYAAAFLIDFLAALGVTRADLSFSGSGDDGAVNDVTFAYRQDRPPTEEQVVEQWRLALARHHLLYPEYSVEGPSQDEKGDRFLAATVEKYFDDHISPNLGDWVNNDGGSGSVGVDIAGGLISHRVTYNSTTEGSSHSGKVKRPALFRALLGAAATYGIARIEAELDFESDSHCWSQNFTFRAADDTAVTLDDPTQTAFLDACHAVASAHPSKRRAPLAASSGEEFTLWLHEAFVEKAALALGGHDEMESYNVTLSLGMDSGAPVLEWTVTFTYLDTEDGESDEIAAPVIAPPPRRSRRPSRRAA
ncbi:MAG: hypothetical protein Q8N18_20175 [Opitutaceae bacterium]|nr:hypothetical protein [Opitutaceae bacterium]